MRKLALALTAAAGLVSFTGAALAYDANVRIWSPTEAPDVPSHIDGEDSALVRPVKVKVRVAVAVFYPNHRRLALHRAFGQRYLGFVKQYSGPRYPL